MSEQNKYKLIEFLKEKKFPFDLTSLVSAASQYTSNLYRNDEFLMALTRDGSERLEEIVYQLAQLLEITGDF